jgi:dienelactone hydrolase
MSGQSANIHTETVSYTASGTTLRGYLAYDESADAERPGVLVVHEWWGLNEYIRRRAQMLAELGYTALAVDMYGEGQTADNPDEAGRLMNTVLQDMRQGEARFKAGYELLKGQSTTDAHMAAIGYCFGGAMVLHAARIGMDLDGVVSFHGALGSAHKPTPGGVRARILVCHGAADSLVPDDDITAFKREMAEACADYRFEAYEGALHGFTNPDADENGKKYGLPLAYSAQTDRRSWQAMQDFFNAIFS